MVNTICIDVCGNSTNGLFSYIQIGQSSGVMSGSSVSPTPSADSAHGLESSQLVATVTVNHGTTVVVTSFAPSDPTITMSTTDSRNGASDPSTTSSATGSGIASNQANGSGQSSQTTMERSSSFWDSTGKVAGVFVAVGIVTAMLAGALLWMCRNRKSRRDEEKSEESPRQTSGEQPVSRSTSLLQLLGRGDRSRTENVAPSPPNQQRLSRSPTELAIPVVDQRLDPQTMMIRFEDNDSRTSFRDEEDYSRRVWRVTNASDTESVRSAGELR
jgi:hypothetical protein